MPVWKSKKWLRAYMKYAMLYIFAGIGAMYVACLIMSAIFAALGVG